VGEVKVVFFSDACEEHRVEFFNPDTVALRMTWKCDKCKAVIWKTAESKCWRRV